MVAKISLTLSLFFCLIYSQGQPSNTPKVASNHVVIGAFASHENAIRFTDDARSFRPEVKLDLNPQRELYYVYVLNTNDRVQAFAEARKLRKESRYWDTWVFYGTLGEISGNSTEEVVAAASPSLDLVNVRDDSGASLSSDSDEDIASEVKAFSMIDEPDGLNLEKLVTSAQSEDQKGITKRCKRLRRQ